MTQKELLYLEDAIGHEKNMVAVLSESIKCASDKNIISFLKNEHKKHKSLEKKLMIFMEEKANE